MNCYLFKPPRIALLYIAVAGASSTLGFVRRFSTTLKAFPTGFSYDLIAVCNGGKLDKDSEDLIRGVSGVCFPRSNYGWDIGGYLEAVCGPAKDYDIVICLGESCYFHRAEWGLRMLTCWIEHGPGMYGFFSSHAVRAHMNTTAFATTPDLLRSWTEPVGDRSQRYGFEHGERCFWRRLNTRNYPVRLVTWDGCWKPGQWRFPQNIMSRGDQSNTLFRCNHWDRFHNADPHVKSQWAATADMPFQ